MLSRREFGLLLLAGALKASSREIPVGLQLFSVRSQCQANLRATLSEVAKLGFRGVEFAGYYRHTPEELRNMLADFGLACCGAHVGLDALQGGKLQQTIDFHRTLGNNTLVVPGLPEMHTRTIDAWIETTRLFAAISETLRANQMRIGYHNHAIEFQLLQGERPWEVFFGNTPRDVFIELDLGNAGYGGADPVAALKRYPGRVRSVHVKDYTRAKPDVMIGEGLMDWRDFFPACENVAGTEWYIIEHDSNPALHLTDIAECLRRHDKLARCVSHSCSLSPASSRLNLSPPDNRFQKEAIHPLSS